MFELVLATLMCFISTHSSRLGKELSSWINRPSAKERDLLLQKNALQQEQSQFTMTDNFAKYSKIQRKINAVTEELTECRNGRNNILLQLAVTHGLRVVFSIILIALSFYYRYTPVFQLDERISLFPFGHVISYPNERNAVSFHFWVLCSFAAARVFKF